MIENTKMEINMSGTEYLKYKKYQDEKRKDFFKLPKLNNRSIGLIIIICSVCALLLIPLIHEQFNPPEPKVWGHSNLWGVTVSNALLAWFAIAIGIAWMVHGFGFIIIRR